MGCVIFVLALMVPRVVMFFIWILTEWFDQSYDSWYMPLLGFFFMPYTTLAYMAAMLHNARAVSGWWLALVIVAAIVDVGHWGGGSRAKRRRKRLHLD